MHVCMYVSESQILLKKKAFFRVEISQFHVPNIPVFQIFLLLYFKVQVTNLCWYNMFQILW